MLLQVNPVGFVKFLLVICFSYLIIVIWLSGTKITPVRIELHDIASYAILAVQAGGHAIIEIFEENSLEIVRKSKTDEGKDELLTRADLTSNFIILKMLERLGVKVISEEKNGKISVDMLKYELNRYESYNKIQNLIDKLPPRKYNISDLEIWLDPLDATQEYTEGLVEYVTVMLCVVAEGSPVFGVIHRPFFNQTFIGLVGHGVYNEKGNKVKPIFYNVSKKIVVSRSHAGSIKDLAKKAFGSDFEVEPAGGSGYKVLRLLNGTAQLYLHNTNIKKWDICAGDAILAAIGGSLMDLSGDRIDYGHNANIKIGKGLLAAVIRPYSFFSQLRKVYSVD